MKILLTMNEASLFKDREYDVHTIDHEMQGFLLEEYEDTDYHPDNLWDCIIATSLIGDIGLIRMDKEIVGYLYNTDKFKAHEIEKIRFDWEEEPVVSQILKLGGKGPKSKGTIYEMQGSGEMTKYKESFAADYKPAYKPGHAAHEEEERSKAALKAAGWSTKQTKGEQ